ncbi:related to IRC20 - putative helicase [Melanopsichium pennsylvanicum]|uniref:Atp-dependent dna helicase n=2 Tax=Melanopsichium pennsylvanicum TaxID=63383 RepID=A0A077RBP2_9BASI|nr:atp-dependent dna helicase [Melanopsichium pennsylvanicum 4]SNX82855.1 related to IRC20 - putative helicase [Melanopsichium pennsylvanicum]
MSNSKTLPTRQTPAVSSNTSIWPVQLRDKETGSSSSSPATPFRRKRLTCIPLPQLDFEDVSYFLDFAHLADHYCNAGLSLDSAQTDTQTLGGKRKRSSSNARGIYTSVAKKKTKEASGCSVAQHQAEFVDTCCLFHVKSREAHDIDLTLKLKEMLSKSSWSYDSQIRNLDFSVIERSSTLPADSLISHVIQLRDRATEKIVAELPVLSSGAIPEKDMLLGTLTNGEWLVSLASLLSKHALTAEFALELASIPPDYPPDRVTAGSLFIKLTIQVQVYVSAHAAGSLAREQIVDMARIVRFADASSDVEDRTVEIDARFVYQNLRPASFEAPDAIQPADLSPTLLPFQKRSTAFVLGREGMALDILGNVVKSDRIMGHDGFSDLGLWWKQVGPGLYYNWIEARFVRDPKLTMLSDLKGAILAEEMGLGKTVEAVALMLLNPDPEASSRPGWYDERNEIDVVPTKTTLIVAPETLRVQWMEEIASHAPKFAVYSYKGRTQAEKDVPDGLTWEQYARRFDVMLISYATLAKELNIAKSAPERSRRQQRRYERPRSPLVKLHFHRVLMDEVQMIGASSAAETVSMISRGSSIAVSGTPVKKMEDLKSCFRFLKVPGYLATPADWHAILHPLLAPALVQVLRTIGTRHTKAQVASEMSLPIQSRAVIPIDFTSIEAAFYADIWKEALTEMAYKQEGDPQTPNHQVDVVKMRQHLLLLRQACTHPQVAVQFRSNVVGAKNLRSIDEVLELMIDSTQTQLHSSKIHWFDRRIHRNILCLYRRDEDQRILAASQLSDVEVEINKDVDILEEEIRQAGSVGPLYRFTDPELELEQKVETRRRRLAVADPDDKHDENGDLALEEFIGDHEAYLALLEKRKARASHVTQLKALLRHLLMKLHRVLQFVGNIYFQRGEYLEEQERAALRKVIGTPTVTVKEDAEIKFEADVEAKVLAASHPAEALETGSEGTKQIGHTGDERDPQNDAEVSPDAHKLMSSERQILKDKENAAYARAEKVRQRLLAEARDEVQAAVSKLNRNQLQFDANSILVSKALFEFGGGILSSAAYQALSNIANLLNQHAMVLFRWRDRIVTRLVRAVNRDVSLERDDDDQYQDNLDTQAEAEVLLEMYRPLLSEREKILKGNVAVGATDRPLLFKQIEAAVRTARQNSLRGIAAENEADQELIRVQQQQLEHFKKLDEECRSVSLADPSRCVQNVAEDLKGLRDNAFGEEEAALAKQAHVEARRIYSEQNTYLDRLRNEEKMLLSALFNARSRYFKEIQVLSDTVRDPNFMDLEMAIQATQKEEIEVVSKVEDLERRLRYLLHLQKVQSADQLDDEAKTCNICTDPIEIGILTNKCGHVCCEICWKEWQSQGHRTCVLCQTRVLPNEVHRIIYKSARTIAQDGQVVSTSEGHNASQTGASGAGDVDPLAMRYQELDDSIRLALNRLATQGRFGSKIDHVAKHVRHIINRSGEKSLIFSSFGRGLDVVAQSLTANGIRFVRLTGAGKSCSEAVKNFRSDASIHVMLLHSEAQSSGLNLLAASHIHILEPLLNTSLELQAIGRVHRIGQTKETNIWCYYVKDTVEERILALQAYKGQSLYLQGQHTSLSDAPNPLEASMSKGTEAEQAQQDAKKWSSFGKVQIVGGGKGAMRGDVTSNSTELLACFFARYLPLLGQVPKSSSRRVVDASADGSSGDDRVVMGMLADAEARGSSSAGMTEDELVELRRIRLAALEQRQSNGSS